MCMYAIVCVCVCVSVLGFQQVHLPVAPKLHVLHDLPCNCVHLAALNLKDFFKEIAIKHIWGWSLTCHLYQPLAFVMASNFALAMDAAVTATAVEPFKTGGCCCLLAATAAAAAAAASRDAEEEAMKLTLILMGCTTGMLVKFLSRRSIPLRNGISTL